MLAIYWLGVAFLAFAYARAVEHDIAPECPNLRFGAVLVFTLLWPLTVPLALSLLWAGPGHD